MGRFVEDWDGTPFIELDPDDKDNFLLDYTAWLAGDTLTGAAHVEKGVRVDSCEVTLTELNQVAPAKGVVFWLSGLKRIVPASLTVSVTSSSGRKSDRTFDVRLAEQ